jgi:F0F1-type ATP synthase membrane subunit c/vacuolar-type H+-ATPase subunit K
VTIPLIGAQVTFTTATRIVYGICLGLCGIGAAIHDRRRESRFLVSMVAPWLLFFVILTQMHGRYSIWAAGLSALLAGVGAGMSLLGVLVSAVSLCGIVENQLLFSREWSPNMLSLLRSCDPGLGWVLVLAAWIYLYVAFMPCLRGGDWAA